jgi:microcystin-dependent protein
MACPDCFKNCGENYSSDRCIEYTGPNIPALGITTGCTLSVVEEAIINSLLSVLDGTGIVLEDVTLDNCVWLKGLFTGKDKTLVNLMQLLIDSQCTLKELIDSFQSTPTIFDIKCLTGLPVNATSTDILQAAVNLLCQHETTISTLSTTYVKQSDLEAMVLQIVQSNPQKINFPKYIPVPFIGNLSNFDNTGKGLGDYLGWYIMNGLNGTPDWRGRKVVGAVRNVPGGSLDNAVNPSIVGSQINYGIGDKFGEAFVALSIAELPPHTHSINDSGHSHPIAKFWARKINYGNENSTKVLQEGQGSNSELLTPVVDIAATKATTGISLISTGGGLPHENRDPSVAAVWIVQI